MSGGEREGAQGFQARSEGVTRYLSRKQIAEALDVLPETLNTWINTHDTPEHDAVFGGNGMYGWREDRLHEWRVWHLNHLTTRDSRKVRHRGGCCATLPSVPTASDQGLHT